jgi:adenylate cyclase
MQGRGRRRGVFEGPPRRVLHRAGPRFLDACAAVVVLNGVVVALFGVVTVALYVDLTGGELALLAAAWAGGFSVEGLAAAAVLRRGTRPARAWLAGGDGTPEAAEAARTAAARVPVTLLRAPLLPLLGAAAAVAAALVLAALLERPAAEAALALPATLLMYASAVILRYLGLELSLRALLGAIDERFAAVRPLEVGRVSLHLRLLVTVPMVTWGAGMLVGGVLTEDARDLDTVGLAGVVAFGVSAALSMWLSLVIADTVTGPVIDLRDATRRVAAGDLDVRTRVVSTDETGELAATFNAMVAGLDERERLREAFGTFVDPAVTERVLAEGTDLQGEEVEVTVLFLDVRDFTGFAERSAPHEVVAALNELYEAVVPVIVRHGGHANKFVGDGLLAVFGAPDRHADHARRAVAAACEIGGLLRDGRGGVLRAGVGVNTGAVLVGTIGGAGRRDFTVIGDAVNTAVRVQEATRVTGDDVLVAEATVRALGGAGDGFEERPAAPLKGKAEPVRLYAPRAIATLKS